MKTYDAIVVHGHGVTPHGDPDLHTAQRVDTAMQLWQNGVADTVAFTGGYSFTLKNPPALREADSMKQYALSNYDIDPAFLKTESESLDTVGNVVNTKTKLALENDWNSLIVVTSDSHLSRTLAIYKHIFGASFQIDGNAAPEKITLKEKVWEPLGTAMTNLILKGTLQGDHEHVQERLEKLVPGYGNDATVKSLAIKSLLGVASQHKTIK